MALAEFGTKIISYYAISREPHREVGELRGGRDWAEIVFLAVWQKEMYPPSLLLIGNFCRNCVYSLNIRHSVTYRPIPFCKIPNICFFHAYQNSCLSYCVGVACLGKKLCKFSSLGGACYTHKTNGDFLG